MCSSLPAGMVLQDKIQYSSLVAQLELQSALCQSLHHHKSCFGVHTAQLWATAFAWLAMGSAILRNALQGGTDTLSSQLLIMDCALSMSAE